MLPSDSKLQLAKTGHAQKKNDLLDAVQKLVKDKRIHTPFTDDRPGETWYRGFLKRYPQLSARFVMEPDRETEASDEDAIEEEATSPKPRKRPAVHKWKSSISK